jgi:hypothetical protein
VKIDPFLQKLKGGRVQTSWQCHTQISFPFKERKWAKNENKLKMGHIIPYQRM